MEQTTDLATKRRMNPVRETLTSLGLYHSFRLPGGDVLQGAMPLEDQERRLAAFELPTDLAGRRVLDIGPWDGYYSFEMERRGAAVMAIDYVDLDTFRALHCAFGSRVEYRRLDIYELDPQRDGQFDIVLCLGVLYHLKHPLLGLEKACAVTRDRCIVDTFVSDGEAWLAGIRAPLPYIEFYERDELAGQLDNWCGPSVSAVLSLVRAAGFASAELLRVTDTTATVAAHRRWRHLPPDEGPPIKLIGLNCHLHRGRSFRSHKEEYIALWCEWTDPTPPALEEVFPEIDSFGVAPISSDFTEAGLLISLRVPPGLSPGEHQARVKIGNFAWSAYKEFFVDLSPIATALTIESAQDGIVWRENEVDWQNGGWLTLWIDGLSPEADAGNTVIEIDNIPHLPEAVFPATGQLNLRLRPVISSGLRRVRVKHRGACSQEIAIAITGAPPMIRGLERLMPFGH